MSAVSVIPRVEPRADRRKRCSLCREWWPIDAYTRDHTHPDGRENRCRACRNEYRRGERQPHYRRTGS